MSWTGAQLRGMARGVTPSPYGNIRLMNLGLPDTRRPYTGSDGRLTLDDYRTRDVAREFYDFSKFVRGYEVGRVLEANYWDDQGDYRDMRQLGGHFGRDRDSVHLTYASKTSGEPVHRYNMVFGYEGYRNAEAVAWRDLAGVVMTPSSFRNKLITGASVFVANEQELKSWFGDFRDLRELATKVFVAQNDGSYHDVKLTQRNSTEPRFAGDALIASSRFYADQGKVEIIPLPFWGGNYMIVVNNVARHRDWTRSYAKDGIVGLNGDVSQAFRYRGGRDENQHDYRDPVVVDKLDEIENYLRRQGGRSLHDLYSWLNRGGVWQATGAGL